MLAIEIVTDRASKAPDPALTQKLIDAACAEGLLVIKCGVQRNVIRFLAPLTTTAGQIDEALKMLNSAFQSVT